MNLKLKPADVDASMKKNTTKYAFSLIEVLVFVTILALFFISAAAVVTASLRNMKLNEHKIIASHCAEELLEWFRGEKETDWDVFITKKVNNANNSEDNQICFNSQELISQPESFSTTDCDDSLDSLYNRGAWFIKKGTTQVDVFIKVSWKELGNTYSVPLRSTFSIWE